MRPIVLVTTATLALAACAPAPDAIAPVAMPSGMFDHLSCQQAAAERDRLGQRLAALESRQRSAAAGDAVGVLLIGLPVSSLTGSDAQGLIAAEKGKLAVLDARLGRC